MDQQRTDYGRLIACSRYRPRRQDLAEATEVALGDYRSAIISKGQLEKNLYSEKDFMYLPRERIQYSTSGPPTHSCGAVYDTALNQFKQKKTMLLQTIYLPKPIRQRHTT